jgi:hypothetical protein
MRSRLGVNWASLGLLGLVPPMDGEIGDRPARFQRVRPLSRPSRFCQSRSATSREGRVACRRVPALDLCENRFTFRGWCGQNLKACTRAPLECTACTEAEPFGDHHHHIAKPLNDRGARGAPCTGYVWDSRRAPCAARWSRMPALGWSTTASGRASTSGAAIAGNRPRVLAADRAAIARRRFAIADRTGAPVAVAASARGSSVGETLRDRTGGRRHARRSRPAFLRICDFQNHHFRFRLEG